MSKNSKGWRKMMSYTERAIISLRHSGQPGLAMASRPGIEGPGAKHYDRRKSLGSKNIPIWLARAMSFRKARITQAGRT